MENPKQKEERAKRDAEIAKLYPNLTLMEIGKKYRLSKSRLSQIIVKAKVEKVEKVKVKKYDENKNK